MSWDTQFTKVKKLCCHFKNGDALESFVYAEGGKTNMAILDWAKEQAEQYDVLEQSQKKQICHLVRRKYLNLVLPGVDLATLSQPKQISSARLDDGMDVDENKDDASESKQNSPAIWNDDAMDVEDNHAEDRRRSDFIDHAFAQYSYGEKKKQKRGRKPGRAKQRGRPSSTSKAKRGRSPAITAPGKSHKKTEKHMTPTMAALNNEFNDQNEEEWQNFFDKLVHYHEQHGHYRIPSIYTITEDGVSYKLGKWLAWQKQSFDIYFDENVERYKLLDTLISAQNLWAEDLEIEEEDMGQLYAADHKYYDVMGYTEAVKQEENEQRVVQTRGRQQMQRQQPARRQQQEQQQVYEESEPEEEPLSSASALPSPLPKPATCRSRITDPLLSPLPSRRSQLKEASPLPSPLSPLPPQQQPTVAYAAPKAPTLAPPKPMFPLLQRQNRTMPDTAATAVSMVDVLRSKEDPLFNHLGTRRNTSVYSSPEMPTAASLPAEPKLPSPITGLPVKRGSERKSGGGRVQPHKDLESGEEDEDDGYDEASRKTSSEQSELNSPEEKPILVGSYVAYVFQKASNLGMNYIGVGSVLSVKPVGKSLIVNAFKRCGGKELQSAIYNDVGEDKVMVTKEAVCLRDLLLLPTVGGVRFGETARRELLTVMRESAKTNNMILTLS